MPQKTQTKTLSHERLQKVLAKAGFGSRRQIETWITAGRIKVNGQLAQLGDRVALNAKITIDDKPAVIRESQQIKCRVLIYHKPEGEICTRRDPEERPTVFDRLPVLHGGRWVAVGRLDINTSGLLLMTNDGELANRLMHPSAEIEREYAVRILGEVTAAMIKQLKKGVKIEGEKGRFNEIEDAGGEGANHWYHVILKEGRNREVRRLWESQGVKVSRLIRIRFGNILLPRTTRAGRWKELEKSEIDELMKLVTHQI